MGVDPESLLEFRQVIGERLGLGFEERKLAELEGVLQSRLELRRLTPRAYLDDLLRNPSRVELSALAPLLTVSETFFFRHRQQLSAFCDGALRRLLESDGGSRSVNILSAGCASGEEPYSLAILTQEAFPNALQRIRIKAGDINPLTLERARRAEFSRWSLRETDDEAARLWFTPRGNNFTLIDSIRERVEFTQLNLADDDDSLLGNERYDIIFCRNVLMYFRPEQYQRAVQRLSRALVPGGCLFLGHAETLRGMDSGFTLESSHGAFFYRRGHSFAQSLQQLPLYDFRSTSNAETGSTDWLKVIEASSQRVADLANHREVNEQANTGAEGSPAAPLTANAAQAARGPADLSVALDLLSQERFDQALFALRLLPAAASSTPEATLLETILLLHRNQLVEAEQNCFRLLEFPELRASAHYLLALCCEAKRDFGGAIEHDCAAVDFDPTFSMPCLHMGRLYRRAGDATAARSALALAHELLEREEPARLVLFSAGFGRSSLLALCESELQSLEQD